MHYEFFIAQTNLYIKIIAQKILHYHKPSYYKNKSKFYTGYYFTYHKLNIFHYSTCTKKTQIFAVPE